MSLGLYDAQHTSHYYDQFGEQEWERLVKNATNHINFHVHKWYLEKYIQPGDRVLEAGAGPGRFTIELGKLGAQITVGDISPKQLELNEQKVKEFGYEHRVVTRQLLNIVNLSEFPSNHFEAVVCYGGPLSYTFDKFHDAMSELLRVTKPDGYVLFSVMSCIGTTRAFLPGILQHYRTELIDSVFETGDLIGELADHGHHCHMFRWSELKSLLEQHACMIIDASAANYLSPGHDGMLNEIMKSNPTLWESILKWELKISGEPGTIDGGTHILAVLQKCT